MNRLLITSCSNSLMWYRDMVGQVVPLVRDLHTEQSWLSREPDGFANIVRKCDAVLLPLNHLPVQATDLVQHGDFIHTGPGAWFQATPEQIGIPVGQQIVVRRCSTSSI